VDGVERAAACGTSRIDLLGIGRIEYQQVKTATAEAVHADYVERGPRPDATS
jgi:hypothetical protein